MNKKDLYASLDHLKVWLSYEIGPTLHSLGCTQEQFKFLMDNINHAIDHIITDHCNTDE